MRPELLKTLRDVISDGHDVKRRAAAAISSIERTGSAAQKQALTDFFSDCGVKAGGTPPVIIPATSAVIASGVGIVKPVTGTFVTTITPTIVAGVITGFVLS